MRSDTIKRGFEHALHHVDDKIVMSHASTPYSLPSRKLIPDAVKSTAVSHCSDAMICIPNCDKITLGMLMGVARVNIPTIFVSGGPMHTGQDKQGNKSNPAKVFEEFGKRATDTISDEQLLKLEQINCPTCGSCSRMFMANSMNCLCEALNIALLSDEAILAVSPERPEPADKTGAQIICEALIRDGVEAIFGIPGGAIMPFYYAMWEYHDQLRQVLFRDEWRTGYDNENWQVFGNIGYGKTSASGAILPQTLLRKGIDEEVARRSQGIDGHRGADLYDRSPWPIASSGLYGRAPELRKLEALLNDASGTSQALFVVGGGGAGKTRLLKTIADTLDQDEHLFMPPYDFYSVSNWGVGTIEKTIIESLCPEWTDHKSVFAPYEAARAKLEQARQSGDGIEAAQRGLRATFVECYNRMAAVEHANHCRVVLLFDTVEQAVIQTDFADGGLINNSASWGGEFWLRDIAPKLRNTLLVLSGRQQMVTLCDALASVMPHEQIDLHATDVLQLIAELESFGQGNIGQVRRVREFMLQPSHGGLGDLLQAAVYLLGAEQHNHVQSEGIYLPLSQVYLPLLLAGGYLQGVGQGEIFQSGVPRNILVPQFGDGWDGVMTSRPFTKHNYLIQDVLKPMNDAIHIVASWRPALVLFDLIWVSPHPSDILRWDNKRALLGFKPTYRGTRKQARESDLVEWVSVPVLNKAGAFLVDQLLDGSKWNEGHGYRIFQEFNVPMSVGRCFEDRVTSKASRFVPQAKIIRLDIDPSELEKNVKVTVPIFGDARNVLVALLEEFPGREQLADLHGHASDWTEHIRDMKAKHKVEQPKNGGMFHDYLYLFNVLVALEWQPSQAYLEQLKIAFIRASDFLFDVIDGWMAFGQIVFGGAELMNAADIQIMVSTRMPPRSWVGAMHPHSEYQHDEKYTPIRLGRGLWNDNRRGIIPWDEPEGYRIIIQEWGHHALKLIDEYIETHQFMLPSNARQTRAANQPAPGIMIVTLKVATTSDAIIATTEGTSDLVTTQWDKLHELYPRLPPVHKASQVRPGLASIRATSPVSGTLLYVDYGLDILGNPLQMTCNQIINDQMHSHEVAVDQRSLRNIHQGVNRRKSQRLTELQRSASTGYQAHNRVCQKTNQRRYRAYRRNLRNYSPASTLSDNMRNQQQRRYYQITTSSHGSNPLWNTLVLMSTKRFSRLCTCWNRRVPVLAASGQSSH